MLTRIRLLTGSLLIVVLLIIICAASLLWVWRYRAPLDALPWQVADVATDVETSVSVTWLGISSLLFDDGDTQILIDGAFTRLSPLDIALLRKVRSDIATINYVLDEYRIDRLAAIVPVHSHFDHAIDLGQLTNRSKALLLGSESAANIARGADVPVDQFQILASGESRLFGEFTVTLLESRHIANRLSGDGWPDGVIEEPLEQPARFWAWRGGVAHAILLAHPAGNALIQGSAGFLEGALDAYEADAVFLSVAGLAGRGRDYTQQYWRETVTATGAKQVYAIHFDDFTRPLGEVMLFPDVVDKVVTAADWLNEAAEKDQLDILRPPFGESIRLY